MHSWNMQANSFKSHWIHKDLADDQANNDNTHLKVINLWSVCYWMRSVWLLQHGISFDILPFTEYLSIYVSLQFALVHISLETEQNISHHVLTECIVWFSDAYLHHTGYLLPLKRNKANLSFCPHSEVLISCLYRSFADGYVCWCWVHLFNKRIWYNTAVTISDSNMLSAWIIQECLHYNMHKYVYFGITMPPL